MERTGTHLAVLFLDLDNFKTVNDSLGHSTGDEMLGRVAESLVGCLRKPDTGARLGGDEFAVLVEDIATVAKRCQWPSEFSAAMRRPVTVGTKEVSATVSIGITFDSRGRPASSFCGTPTWPCTRPRSGAKTALRSSGNEMHTTVVARLEVEADLRSGVDQRRAGRPLSADRRPSTPDDIVGFEALVRWQHPTRGLLSPDRFIPFAEESDLMVSRSTRFVLAAACGQVAPGRARSAGARLPRISVNVSSRDSSMPHSADDVAAVLARAASIPPT